jgi:putative transposase
MNHPPDVMESTVDLYSKQDIEQIVVMERLHLYNRALPCGAKAIRKLMEQEGVRPLPSVSTIKRILSRNCLTYGRTGYYPGDENGEYK